MQLQYYAQKSFYITYFCIQKFLFEDSQLMLLKLGYHHPQAMHWMIMDFKVRGDFYLLFYLMSPSLQMCNSDLVWSQIERICQLFHITFILTLFQN